MPHTWTETLLTYRYPVDLREFDDAKKYPGWFTFNSPVGDHQSTMEFEAHFREHAAEAIEPWLEVVYWKMYSQPATRGNKLVRRIAIHFEDNAITPQSLWAACRRYVADPTRQHFNSIRRLLGLKSGAIAVAATFPAFLKPDLFPMVDTRVAKWVGHCMLLHNAEDPSGPRLIRPPFVDSRRTVLTMTDFPFVGHWILWCRHTARKLTVYTSSEWRPRDIEMTIFTAWGGRHDQHPKFDLTPLPAIVHD